MPSKSLKAALSFALILTTYICIWESWIQGRQLCITVAIMAAAVWGLGKIHQSGRAAQVLPSLAPAPILPPEMLAPSAWTHFFLCLAGLAISGAAYRALVTEHWIILVIMLGASVWAWRSGLPLRLPTLSRPALAGLLCLALLTGAAFRLYKAGEVPIGFCSYDESVIKMEVGALYSGQRSTMVIMPGLTGDGALPHYIEALSMHIFGTGLDGFRMNSILIGIFLTLIMFHIGRDKGDPWTGLAVAFLWAMCLWPVSVSRANYLLIETHLIVLLCFFFLVKAIKQNHSGLFAGAGFFWAFSLQVYHAAQILIILVPLLMFLVWFLQHEQRKTIYDGIMPLLGGLIVGLGPMLLWAWTDPKNAYVGNFGVLYAQNIGAMPTAMNPLKALDSLLGRSIPMFPTTMKMLTVRGPLHCYFFPGSLQSDPTYPIFNQSVIYLFLIGFAVAIARFRNPYYALLTFWWFASLLPGLVAAPGDQPDDRRSMMILLPTLFLAGIGFVTPLDFLTRPFTERIKKAIFLVLGLAFFSWLAMTSWHNYFVRNQTDPGLLTYNLANTTTQARAIYDENEKAPIALIKTEGSDSWNMPSFDVINNATAALSFFPTQTAQLVQGYYENDGLFGSLRWAASQVDTTGKKRDILVALTPFHFYLEPLLHQLGGQTVSEVAVVKTSQGDLTQGFAIAAPIQDVGMKLIRLHDFNPSTLDTLQNSMLFNFTAEALLPPGNLARRTVGKEPIFGKEILKQMLDYKAQPAHWKSVQKVSFKLPDPWFWMTCGALPQAIVPPLRLRTSFNIIIPSAGLYSFGASTSCYMTLKLNGKEVFYFLPWCSDFQAGELWNRERDGILGNPIFLKPGTYRMDAEQVWLSNDGNINHTFRVMWERPGGVTETLPLSSIQPLALALNESPRGHRK